MSMNKFMHPRNIYKTPPDFKELALEFPEFRPFVKQEINGKVSLDFKNLESLRALSCTLLKKDFDLKVEMPLNKLIPTIPLRLNYILWIEDILKVTKKSGTVLGIDIGTGASCVYPLLAAVKNKWSMVATEKDDESFECAKSNVERNNLQNLIQVVLVKGNNLLEDIIEGKEFDFCMCNPPFFSSPQELHPFFKARKTSRPHPKNAFCATLNEVVSKGGEVEFITKLIHESKRLNKRIKIYSTMIGHKCNIPPLKKLLKDLQISSYKETTFCQGNTTRWGLAWTFCEDFNLRRVAEPAKDIAKSGKPKNPLIHPLPDSPADKYALNTFSEKLTDLFKKLNMVVEEVTRNDKVLRYFVTASSNTWSHQRRKRREKTKANNETTSECNTNVCIEDCKSSSEDSNMSGDAGSPGKRTHDDSFDSSCLKKLKISTGDGDKAAVFYKFMAALKLVEEKLYLELNCMEESENREYLHQILQYIKNNL